MKFFNKAVILFLLFTMIGGICFAAPKKKDPLDAAIRETSDYLNANIAKGSKIVILNIQSESGALSEYMIDELIYNTVNDRVLLVVDRQQLDAIRAEQNFQFSGEVDDKQALEIGKFFGAQTIVSGAMSMIGKEYRLRIRALEVQTALVQGQFNKNIAKSPLITTLLASKPSGTAAASSGGGKTTTTTASSSSSGGKGLTIVNNTGKTITEASFRPMNANNNAELVVLNFGGNIAANQTKQLAMPKFEANRLYSFVYMDSEGAYYAKLNFTFTQGMTITFLPSDMFEEAPKLYKIGDKGPAGGIIFYDKKNNSGGWRYLEVAPVEAEFQAPRSAKGTPFEKLQEIVGTGKRNTLLINEKYSQTSGEWDTAAQKCVDLEFGGFKDWFLPSKDELDQIYGQLKRKNLGDFKNDWYQTSSFDYYTTWSQNFGNGSQDHRGWADKIFVRPIRQVAGPDK